MKNVHNFQIGLQFKLIHSFVNSINNLHLHFQINWNFLYNWQSMSANQTLVFQCFNWDSFYQTLFLISLNMCVNSLSLNWQAFFLFLRACTSVDKRTTLPLLLTGWCHLIYLSLCFQSILKSLIQSLLHLGEISFQFVAEKVNKACKYLAVLLG